MEDIKNILESILNEAASDKVRNRLAKKYMDANPDGFVDENGYRESIDDIHDNVLPDSNKSQADLEWIADKHFLGGGDRQYGLTHMDDVKHMLAEFNKPAIKEKMPKKKLNQYKSWDEFSTAIKPHIGSAPTVKETANKDTKVLFKNDTHIVRQHLSQESMIKAAKLHPENPFHKQCKGKATWCISVDDKSGKDYHESYTKGGTHPVYTIEHTDKHPTDPHRKFAIVADPDRNTMGFKGVEFRDEPQLDTDWHEKYLVSHDNKSIENTEPMQYLHKALNYSGHGRFKKEQWDGTHEYTINDKGEKHGEEVITDASGNKIGHTNYFEGDKHGSEMTKDYDSIMYRNYVHGQKHGESKTTNLKGATVATIQYKNGDRHGISNEYMDDGSEVQGKLLKSTPWKDGEKHGEETNYHSNGMKEVTNWNEGFFTERKVYKDSSLIQHSIADDPESRYSNISFKTFHPNGMVEVEGKTDSNFGPIGLMHHYTESGKLHKITDNSPEDETTHKKTTFLNDEGKIKKTTEVLKTFDKIESEYDPDTQNRVAAHTYDNTGRKMHSLFYDNEGKKSHYEKFYKGKLVSTGKYDKETGLKSEMTAYTDKGNKDFTMKYDKGGFPYDKIDHQFGESVKSSFRTIIEGK